jgi:Carboxypeptidase regulatory-like domain
MQLRIAGLYLVCALAAFAQGDRGTITGTVTDPTGAVVPNANIQVTNTETAGVFKIGTSSTGNYTLANVPVGTYVLSVDAPGFKKYERPNLAVQVAETIRVDAVLEVGSSSETVTVSTEAPLLKTESGEISHQVDYDQINLLPIFNTNGAGTSTLGNIRDPLTVLNVMPGAQQTTDTILRVNGLPSSSQTIMVEGMDATNGMWRQQNQSTQQGVDAIQEVSIQTSNFAAEYGGAGGGYLNFTMKSGTNQYHGSAYDYFVNSALNAGLAFSANCNEENNCATNPNSGLIKNVIKRNDYGFTLGGPIRIPKLYNGKDKTFFFFSFEQFRQSTVTNNGLATVPSAAYQSGNFASAEGFGPFPLPFLDPFAAVNEIFDPATRTNVNGKITESPFPGNAIPVSRMDPVALYLQSFFPSPNLTGAGTLNNYAIPAYSNFRHTTIPSMKIDQVLNSKMRLSGYVSATETNSPNTNGFATDLAPAVPDADRAYTYRLNFDDTISPTLLFHLGAGLLYFSHPDLGPQVASFNAGAIKAAAGGFGGAPGGSTWSPFPASNYMPSFAGLNDAFVGGGIALGSGFFAPSPGSSSLAAGYVDTETKPTANTSLTWVHGNHTFKVGADMILDGIPQQSSLRAFGEYTFSAQQTENPAEYGQNLFFTSGFPYASFLLGQVSAVETSAINDSRLGNHAWGAFIQDSWKVSRKLTLELGLRWDYATLYTEEHGRMSDACFTCVNPALASPYSPGGLAGGIVYGATNNGPLSDAYPFSLGPHLGVAYQITPKTVFRAGGSIAYSSTADNAFLSASVANFYTVGSPGNFLPAAQLSHGNPLTGSLAPTFPEYNQYPFPISASGCGLTGSLPCVPPTEPFITIPKSTRLPRIFQWSVGFQQEIAPNLMVDAAYVGNRGAWFTAPLLDTQSFNGLTQQRLSNLTTEGPGGAGVYGATSDMAFTNPADYALLQLQINNPAVIARFPKLADPSNVYPGFPSTQTLAQALRPYPQWYGVPSFLGPPDGTTWYDSLQVKVTKRYSHGLTAQIAYTFSKSLTNAANSNTSYLTPNDPVLNDPYNIPTDKQLSGFDQPQVLVISANYTTPKLPEDFLGGSGFAKGWSWLARDWNIGAVLKYASGQLIQSSPSNLTLWNTMGIGGTPLNGVSNFGGSEPLANYVPGQSCLAVNPNSHFDPTKTLALNPNAWSEPTTETFGDAAPFYTNCRWQRQPAESLSLGRVFRITEKMQLLIQAQFFNPFNRVFYALPSIAGPTNVNLQSTPTFSNPFPGSANPTGALSAGFGWVNALNGGAAVNGVGPNPRSGQLVARFTF